MRRRRRRRAIRRRGSPKAQGSPSKRPRPEESPLLGEDLPLEIIYEDEHLIVIDKPAGLVVHPAPGHADGTLVNALIRHCGASLSGIGGVRRPGIVHRLDKDTSGLLVVAKTDAAHRGLADLFADHGRSGSLEREYLALVWGGLRRGGGQSRRGDRPRIRGIAKGWRPRQGSAAARQSPIGGFVEAFGRREPRRLPARNRTHPSDPRSHGLDRPSAPGRFGLWRGIQDQGGAVYRGRKSTLLTALGRQALHAAVLGFRTSDHWREAPLRARAPCKILRTWSMRYAPARNKGPAAREVTT